MKRIPLRVLALLVFLVAFPASAAIDAFLKIDGVPGESKDPGHMGWIEIDSATLGGLHSTTVGSATGGAGAGKIKFNEFKIRKVVDSASPAFKLGAASGRHFALAVLECRKAGGGPYLKYVLHNVMVSSYHWSGQGHGGTPETETFNLTFEKIELDSSAQGIVLAANPGVALSPPPAITKVTPSPSTATVGTPISFIVEGIGSCKRGRIDWGDGVGFPGDVGPEYELVNGKGVSVQGHTYTKPGNYEVKAYGAADPMAKPTAPPPPGENACGGHATAILAISEGLHPAAGVNLRK